MQGVGTRSSGDEGKSGGDVAINKHGWRARVETDRVWNHSWSRRLVFHNTRAATLAGRMQRLTALATETLTTLPHQSTKLHRIELQTWLSRLLVRVQTRVEVKTRIKIARLHGIPTTSLAASHRCYTARYGARTGVEWPKWRSCWALGGQLYLSSSVICSGKHKHFAPGTRETVLCLRASETVLHTELGHPIH